MTIFLVLLGLVVVLGVLGTLREAHRDRARDIPPSRFVPHDLRPPADNGGRGLDLSHWVV